jgi:hypothetical protein
VLKKAIADGKAAPAKKRSEERARRRGLLRG